MNDRLIVLRTTGTRVNRGAFDGIGATPRFETAGMIAAGLRIEIEENPKRNTFRALNDDPGLVGMAPAMPVALIQPLPASADTDSGRTDISWGVAAVGATKSPFDGSGVTVAVLDTGIDAGHEAFKGVQLVERDFTGGGNGDQNGHGTHCAGTIFGRTVNGMRIGVAPGVTRALIGKVIGGPSGGGSDVLSAAMLWAYEQGANVISMSLGLDFPGYVESLVQGKGLRIREATSLALEAYGANVRLFDRLASYLCAVASFAQGVLITAASGNESGRNQTPPFEISVSPPAAAPGIVSVAALGPGKQGLTVAPFSNSRALLSAPGVNIVSARAGGGIRALSGTSMAAPHVAGATALWAQKLKLQGSLSPVILQARVIASGTFSGLDAEADSLDVGAGMVQAPAD